MTWATLGPRDQLDPEVVRLVEAGTPFARTLGARLVELGREHAVLVLDAPEELCNHVGGPHAATLFGLAETAAAGVLVTLFQDLVQAGCVPLIKGAEISYRAISRGRVRATATFVGDADGVRASVAARGVAVFPVDVVLTDEDGTPTAALRAEMALKRWG